jgi:hypothetical protein
METGGFMEIASNGPGKYWNAGMYGEKNDELGSRWG